MAEVVFGLESILALQERNDNSVPEKGIITFGKKLRKYFSLSEQIFDNQRYDIDMPNNILGELVAVGWPSWLAAVAGEALKGWLPRRTHTFKNLGKIGEGSYSVVYKARDLSTGNVVALKRIQCDTSDPESVKMIAMEIVILRRLDHPNVIKLEGIVTSRMSETLYLVFEYMDHDLATLSAKPDTEITVPQVKHYMHQLISGLKHCHDKQVLHRDIKGSDLLLDNNGVLKIADFGSASFVDLILEQPMTNRMATFWYRAPELLLGATEYGVGIDLWSSGCILAGLLANKPILAGHTEAEQLQKIYTLCGSPTDEYWKTYKLPLETLYKPQLQFQRCIADTFKDFPPSSLPLLDILLSFDPINRQSAASALESKFLSEISQINQSQITEMEAIGSTASNTNSHLGERKDYVKKSVQWNHFTESVKNDGKKKSRCTYCAVEYECASTIEATLTLTNHMKTCASNPANQTQTRRKSTSTAARIEETREIKVSLLSWKFDHQVAGKAIIEMIMMDKLPFKSDLGEGHKMPNSFDWDNVERLVGFLQHYYQLTLRVSGTKYITSYTFLDSISSIHSVAMDCFSSEDAELRKMSLGMKTKFDKYWGDIHKFNLFVFIASVFDPRTKFTHLKVTICNLYGDDDGRKIVASCRSVLYELFDEYKRIHFDQHVSNISSSSDHGMSITSDDAKSELDRYLTEDIEDDKEYFQSEDFSVLDWWKKRSKTFPILSLVARDILAMPISTVALEKHIQELDKYVDDMRETLSESSVVDG
ncbi:hypothetical protein CTI12_AA426370 [Artemisia annua]|uniref:Protein kinase domain-containing protein n=1 Tax=Artemisia annua TaxID=35608 RepID=A0A2U1M2Y9_ARTAN|nr:hypothetical protein CTI12_AA426370 [Artemisia annua]